MGAFGLLWLYWSLHLWHFFIINPCKFSYINGDGLPFYKLQLYLQDTSILRSWSCYLSTVFIQVTWGLSHLNAELADFCVYHPWMCNLVMYKDYTIIFKKSFVLHIVSNDNYRLSTWHIYGEWMLQLPLKCPNCPLSPLYKSLPHAEFPASAVWRTLLTWVCT